MLVVRLLGLFLVQTFRNSLPGMSLVPDPPARASMWGSSWTRSSPVSTTKAIFNHFQLGKHKLLRAGNIHLIHPFVCGYTQSIFIMFNIFDLLISLLTFLAHSFFCTWYRTICGYGLQEHSWGLDDILGKKRCRNRNQIPGLTTPSEV